MWLRGWLLAGLLALVAMPAPATARTLRHHSQQHLRPRAFASCTSLVGYAQKLREGEVRLSAADLPRLHKLCRELWAEVPAGASEPAAQVADEDESEAVEHKRQVLQALREAGLLEQRHPHDGDRDRDRGRDEHDQDPDDRGEQQEDGPPPLEGGSR